jgi:hypothetical protein
MLALSIASFNAEWIKGTTLTEMSKESKNLE